MYKKTHVVFSFLLHEMKNEKNYITTWVFLYIKYSKFWSVLLEHFVEHKPLFSEEWVVEDADEDIPIGLMVMGIVVIMSSSVVILVDCKES